MEKESTLTYKEEIVMSTTFSFIKGIGFTLAMLASLMTGYGLAMNHYEKQEDEEDESESVQDAGVEDDLGVGGA